MSLAENVIQRDPESARDLAQLGRQDVPVAAFDSRDPEKSYAGCLGQFLLGDLADLAMHPHALADGDAVSVDRPLAPCQRHVGAYLTLYGTQVQG